jgi:amino acid transporter
MSSIRSRLRAFFFGPPKDVHDAHTFHAVSLVAMLAWVGLGADGLSSSAYGPDEAFRALMRDGNHSSLAVGLALGTALTVFIIAYGYTRIIEHFPGGGGGYVVATKLLGPRFGVVSGSALLVDYVLTITVSIASGGDQVFNLMPRKWFGQTEVLSDAKELIGYAMPDGGMLAVAQTGTWLDPVQRTKIGIEIVAIAVLTILNIRGVKESVQAILPIFLAFVATHVLALAVAIFGHIGDIGAVTHGTAHNFHSTLGSLGAMGTMLLFVRAYSLGGGTYTGIEAVSNGVQIMREPKVRTAKRTMMLMAISLAITAGGIILAYLLVGAVPPDDKTKTMNWVLLESVAHGWHVGNVDLGAAFVMLALASEAGLLFIAAQAGFVDGPRVMANMAVDSWLPHRFSALSERLSMRNGVMLMSGASIAALIYTHGDVAKLVVMYSINVFLTFSLSNLGMTRFWVKERKVHADWWRHVPIHLIALALCLTILVVTCFEKFAEGGWLTLVITGLLVGLCFWIKRHYKRVVGAIRRLDVDLPDPLKDPKACKELGAIDPDKPVVALFVGGYGGLGRHALLTLLRMFPGHFQGVVFCSVAIVDSGNFKGIGEVHELETRTRDALVQYKKFASTLDLPAECELSTGTEVAVEAEKLGLDIVRKYPKALFVAGQLLFDEDTSFGRVLHNETAFQIQRRLQHAGVPMIVLPVRLSFGDGPRMKTPSMDPLAKVTV